MRLVISEWVPLLVVLVLLMFALVLAACAGIERPDTTVFIVNAQAKQIKGYNLKTDYDDNGNRLGNAVAKIRRFEDLEDLDKYACTDVDGLAELKRFFKDVRDLQSRCSCR